MLCDKCSHLNWQRLKVCKPVVHDFQKVDSGLIDKAKRPFKNAAKILKRITLDSSARDKLSKGCKHHRSTIAVRQAADAGCDLCKLLVDAPTFTAVPTNSPVFYQFQTVEGALSRWSTRNTGYTNVEFCVADTTDNKRMKKFTILNVAALPDSLAAKSGTIRGRVPHSDPLSESCVSEIRAWLRDCLEDHSSCPKNVPHRLPSRVLDVRPFDGTQEPVLRINDPPADGRWIALSHCWGLHETYKLKTENLAQMQAAVPLAELPQTIQDAVKLTRALRIDYLWVDSLCILQDSTQDWVEESAKMGSYYGKSTLTIQVANTSGDHESFSTPRQIDPGVRVPFMLSKTAAASQQKTTAHRKRFLWMRGSSPQYTSGEYVYLTREPEKEGREIIHTRAWTLQEALLSPRILHIRSTQYVWSCTSKWLSEEGRTSPTSSDYEYCNDNLWHTRRMFTLPAPSSSMEGPADTSPWKSGCGVMKIQHTSKSLLTGYVQAVYPEPWVDIPNLAEWYRIVEDFTARNITHQSDRLIAMSGIAREVHKAVGYRYLAGLWVDEMTKGLTWYQSGPWDESRDDYSVLSWPSWSWASASRAVKHAYPYPLQQTGRLQQVSHDVSFTPPAFEPEASMATIENFDPIHTHGDEFGAVKSCPILLKARCRPWFQADNFAIDGGVVLTHGVHLGHATSNPGLEIFTSFDRKEDFDRFESQEWPFKDGINDSMLCLIALGTARKGLILEAFGFERGVDDSKPSLTAVALLLRMDLLSDDGMLTSQYRRIGLVVFRFAEVGQGGFNLDDWEETVLVIV